MDPRGRGRGLGRGRGQQQQQQQQQHTGSRGNGGGGDGRPRPGPSGRQQPAAPPAQQQQQQPQPSAWGQAQAWPRAAGPSQSQQQQQSAPVAGRGATVRSEGGAVRGEGAGQLAESRAIRGRVVNREIIYTKPVTCTTKKGSTGEPIVVQSNYLSFLHTGQWCLYQYRVDFAPDIDKTSDRRALVRTAVKDLIKGGYLFDGSVLYCPLKLNPDVIELFAQTPSNENIRITIKLVGDVSHGDFHYLQIFNIIMRKCLKLMDLQQVGRYFYLPQSKEHLHEHKLQVWPGFFTSIRQHEKEILLNVDLQSKVMRTDTVYDMLVECQSGNMRREFQSKIIGGVVLTIYNNKTYRIDDVDFNSTPMSTFTKADGSKISYMQYFKEKYNCVIRNKDQPMLISRLKAREIRSANMNETVYLVPELCLLTGLSEKQRENFQLMKALAAHTRIGPGDRLQKLQNFANKLEKKPEIMQEIQRWDLKIANNLVQINARILPRENILAGRNAKFSSGPEADWTRDLRSNSMFYNGTIEKLVVVVPNRIRRGAEDFMNALKRAAQGMNWPIRHYEVIELGDDRASSYVERIEQTITKYSPHLILVALPNTSNDRYSAVKKKCSVDRGVPTQMITARSLTSKGVMSIATKVAIQMNCKVGGAPWTVNVPLSGLMMVGYDVCRDTANKKLSFCGMVATLDRHLTRCYNAAVQHEAEEELSSNIAQFLLMACKRYQKVNGAYPERIVIYRDGVGEGQLNYVINHEVTNIKKILQSEIYNNQEPKFAFIVVSKRINTRFFLNKANPPPGTVVDDVVTLPHRYDFYIVSQCVRQGTVTPTSYNVIHDSLNLSADRLQILTYKATHMYFNWSGTVRVPAVCQNAHKLAFLTSQSLHRPANQVLSDVLHFL